MYLRHNHWQAFGEKWTCLYMLEPGSKTEVSKSARVLFKGLKHGHHEQCSKKKERKGNKFKVYLQ